MANANFENRINQGQQYLESLQSKGLHFQRTKKFLFVSDMVERMKSGKRMSAKQSEWYDAIMSAGVPKSQNEEKVNELKAAAQVSGMPEYRVKALNDFAYRLCQGWDLTEKQEQLMIESLKVANELKQTGPWVPTESEKASILLGLNLSKKYEKSVYLSHRPALSKSINQTLMWLFKGGNLDKESAHLMMSSFKGDRAKMKQFEKKFPIGTLLQLPYSELLVTVVSVPQVNDRGQIVVEVFIQQKLEMMKMSKLWGAKAV